MRASARSAGYPPCWAMLYILLLGFLLLYSTTIRCMEPLVVIDLVCQNENDFYLLLYDICTRTVLCRELFYLEAKDANITTLARERDFRKFHYQLSQISFYNVINNSTDPHHHHSGNHHHGDGTLIVNDIWPEPWAPNITVTFVGSDLPPCSETFNMTDLSNMYFIYTSLSIMEIYKQYISNEHYCNDYNERALFDTHLHEFHCICPSEKVCYKEGSWRQLVFTLVMINIAFYFLLVVAVFIVGIRLLPNHTSSS